MNRERGHLPLQKAQGLQGAAKGAIRHGEFQHAYDLLSEALETLGITYYDASVLDDTDLSILAAQDLCQRGIVDQAARVLKGVLETRLTLYERKHGLSATRQQ